MKREVFLSLIAFLAAAICLGTAVFDWNWAMKSEAANPVVNMLGRRNTRIFYALLGIGFATVGVLILTGILVLPQRR